MSDLDIRSHSSSEREALRAIIYLEVNSEEAKPEYRLRHRWWRCQTLEEGERRCPRLNLLANCFVRQHITVGAVRFGTDQRNRS